MNSLQDWEHFLEFRKAVYTDIPALQNLYEQLIPEVKTDPEKMAETLAQVMNTDNNHIVIGVLRGRVIATCQIVIYENLIRTPRRKAVIDSVVVDEYYRGVGIGTAMMEWVMQLLAEKGCSHIGVASRFSRTVAHYFYQKLKFEKFGYYYLFRI